MTEVIKAVEENELSDDYRAFRSKVQAFLEEKQSEIGSAHVSITDVNIELDPRDPSPNRTIEKIVDLTSQTRTAFMSGTLQTKLLDLKKP